MNKFVLILVLIFSAKFLVLAQWEDPKADSVEVGLVLYENSDYEGALNYFNAALEYDAKYTDAWFYKAQCYHDLKDYKRSIKICDKVIKQVDHFMLDAFLLKASSYDKLGDFDNAVSVYYEAIEKYPNSSLLYRKLGVRFLKRERIVDARKVLIDAVKLNHDDALSHRALSHVLFKGGEDLLGVMALYRAILLNPDDGDIVKLVDLLENKLSAILNQGLEEGPIFIHIKKLNLGESIVISSVDDLAKFSRILFGNIETKDYTKDNFWYHYYVLFYQTLNVNSLTQAFNYAVTKEARKDEFGKWMLSESNSIKLNAFNTMVDSYKWPKLLR